LIEIVPKGRRAVATGAASPGLAGTNKTRGVRIDQSPLAPEGRRNLLELPRFMDLARVTAQGSIEKRRNRVGLLRSPNSSQLAGVRSSQRAANGPDILWLVDCLNHVRICQIHQCDVDRSNVCGPTDTENSVRPYWFREQLDYWNRESANSGLTCSPKAEPTGMRVHRSREGPRRILDEGQKTQPGAGPPQVPGSESDTVQRQDDRRGVETVNP